MKQSKETIHGRNVEAILKNDNYNPSQAVAVCKEMVEKDDVFLLSGLAGADQIQACARYAASVGVPYVSLGTTKTALEGLPNYFAFSMTWPAQGRLLGDFFVDRLRGKRKKNGVLLFDTPNYRDTYENFMRSMNNRNADIHYNRAISHGAGQTEAQVVVQEMKAAGIVTFGTDLQNPDFAAVAQALGWAASSVSSAKFAERRTSSVRSATDHSSSATIATICWARTSSGLRG